MRSRPTSFRLTDDDLAKLTSLANPGESQISVIRRAMDALGALERPQDSPAALTPYVALAKQVNALQADLEAHKAMPPSLAHAALPGALPPALPDALPPAGPVVRDALPIATPNALPVAKDALPPTVGYPVEVKRLALEMQDAGHPNRTIAAFILERTGRKPDSKNMGALLKQWRKALSGL